MLIFLVYMFLETIISVQIASSVGGFYTFLEIVITIFVGIFIIKNIHVGLFESLSALKNNEITHSEFERLNFLTVIGALLLILPGYFSDMIGILFQFDFIALIIIRKIFKKSRKKESFKYNGSSNNSLNKKGSDEIIDVEIIDSDTKC